jgi:hypothetical protein
MADLDVYRPTRHWDWHDPVDRKKLKIYMLTFFPTSIISTVLTIYLLNKYDNYACIVALIYLVPANFCKILYPFGQFFEKQDMTCFECFYSILGAVTPVYGFLVVILGSIMFYQSPFNDQFWLLILSIGTFFLDIMLSIPFCCWYRTNRPEQQPLLQEVPIDIEQDPQVSKHAFYSICAVCIEDFKLGDDVKELNCNHLYHPKCIEFWMINHDRCPICKNKI